MRTRMIFGTISAAVLLFRLDNKTLLSKRRWTRLLREALTPRASHSKRGIPQPTYSKQTSFHHSNQPPPPEPGLTPEQGSNPEPLDYRWRWGPRVDFKLKRLSHFMDRDFKLGWQIRFCFWNRRLEHCWSELWWWWQSLKQKGRPGIQENLMTFNQLSSCH